MRICKTGAMILAMALLLGGCASMSRTQEPEVMLPPGTLNAQQVYALFAGKTVESVTLSSGRVSNTYYAPDGELHQLQEGQKRTGQWRVRDDGRICLDIEEGSSKCRIIVREQEGYVKYVVKMKGPHQAVISYRSFRDGNPLGL